MTATDQPRPPRVVPRLVGDSAWTSAQSRGLLTSADQAMAHRFAQAVTELDHLRLRLPAVLRTMRDNQAGTPRSALAGPGPSAPPWCWVHEQATTACDLDGWSCTGEMVDGPSDPTGAAALVADRSARHHHELGRRLELIARLAREVDAIAASYPASVLEVEDEPPSPGEDLCRACWKDNRYSQLIDTRTDGTRYYRYLCKWCGQRRKILGGDKLPAENPAGDPPTWMVEMHHRGQRVMPRHDAEAAAVIAKIVAKLAKRSKAKRARR